MTTRSTLQSLAAGALITLALGTAQAQTAAADAIAADAVEADAADAASSVAAPAEDDSSSTAISAGDGAMDAIGVPDGLGGMITYTDPFCAGFAETFKAQGGDKTLIPPCPEEPVEPLSLSAFEKGEKAGRASAQAYKQFMKQAKPAKEGEAYLAGFYDKSQDNWVTNAPNIVASIRFEGDSTATVHNEETHRMGVINKRGQLVVPVEFQGLGMRRKMPQLIFVENEQKKGVYDINGHIVVPVEYDDLDTYDERHLQGRKGKETTVMDQKGKVLLVTERGSILPAGDNLYWFMAEPQRWGLINARGEVVVQPEFTYTASFQKGRLTSQKDGGDNYTIFSTGKVVKQPR